MDMVKAQCRTWLDHTGAGLFRIGHDMRALVVGELPEQRLAQRDLRFQPSGVVDQIVHLVGTVLEVVQFLQTPDAMISDIFHPVALVRESRRRLGEDSFRLICIDEIARISCSPIRQPLSEYKITIVFLPIWRG